MRIAVAREIDPTENRVAATPETVKKMKGLGADVAVEPDAGTKSGIPDAEFAVAGATVTDAAVKDADVVLKVRRPAASELARYKKGALVIAMMDPYDEDAALKAMAEAGTVPAAKLFVMGAGVAGLQAIATARRLGAIVTATDVRPAAKEQVESLGAKFVAVEDDEFKQAETTAGYAKEMSKEYQAKQAALVAEHVKKQDIVITTALIPGRPAPRLVSKDMVSSMRPGSVIIDLAVERGGNCELAKAGEVIEINGVKNVGHLNVAGRIAASASSLYAKNLYAFLEILVDKPAKALAVKWDDEIVKATALTRDGAVIHPSFAPKSAA